MSVSLLSTKFYIPRPRPNRVERPRLTKKLLAGVETPGSIGLISAPAGSGKTSMLIELVAALKHRVAWLTLDDGDNDVSRFWTYLIKACQSIEPRVGEPILSMLQSAHAFSDETLPTMLINDLVRLEADLVLILDDYHAIQNPSIHAGLSFLVDHLPENLHLVISTRIDPPWPLARLRARNQLVEIRAADLRFTIDEITAFFERVASLPLSPEDIAALESRTEGWIASLQLAAIAMKEHRDVSGFIRAFAGSHIFVADYLVEEVLEQQSQSVQDFLLQTSLLDSLNASLCDAVCERTNSRMVLERLYQSNLFVLPLDQDGQWFRYHHLFRDLLRTRLQQMLPGDELASLHHRAAVWYQQAGMINDAIPHALASGDYERAVQLIEEIALPMIFKAHFKTVEEWLKRIPPAHLDKSLWANLAFAWMYLMRRDVDRVFPYVERLQRLFSTRKEGEAEPALQGAWLTLQSMLVGFQGRTGESRDLAQAALRILPADAAQVRGMAYMSLANAYQQLLDYERAMEATNEIIRSARAAGDLPSQVFGESLLGRMLIQQGKLRAAYETVWQAVQHTERTGSFSPFSATLYGELAQIHYHWHQLDQARQYFSRSVEWSRLGGFSDAEIYHSVFLSRLYQMDGNLEASLQEIEKALHIKMNSAPALVGEEVIAQQVSIYLAMDRLESAQAALEPCGFTFDDSGLNYPALEQHASITHAVGLLYNSALRILLHRAKRMDEHQGLVQGIALADEVVSGAMRCKHIPIALQTLLLRTQLHLAQGHEQAALADVTSVLELAEPEGFISLFIEEGSSIAGLLKRLFDRSFRATVSAGYVQNILQAYPNISRSAPIVSTQGAHHAGEEHESFSLVEPLTPREMQVLQLIAAGESNQAIAEKLVITLSAVKKHTGNIFGKLNVNSRTKAIVRARQLGLLL